MNADGRGDYFNGCIIFKICNVVIQIYPRIGGYIAAVKSVCFSEHLNTLTIDVRNFIAAYPVMKSKDAALGKRLFWWYIKARPPQ